MLRSVRLFRLFLAEQTDPERFYAALAQDAAGQLTRYIPVEGRTILDIGGGAGYFTEAFRARGAHCYLFEIDHGEMTSRGGTPPGAVVADGYWLPVRDGGADVCLSSNVLEHVSDPRGLIEEMVRATRPGGLIYLSFTNWFSPWGGHEMSPWHYLGAGRAERRYLRKHGKLPKNRVGSSLFPRAHRSGAANAAAASRRAGRRGTAALLPGLVPSAAAPPRPARDRHLESAAHPAAD